MITIFISTNRPGSYSERVSLWVKKSLAVRGVSAQILSLEHLPEDFAYRKIRKENLPEFDALMDEKIGNVDKYIFIIPEYNGSYPGILKTLIDSVPPRLFYNKKAALIGLSSGRSGALRALDDFTSVLHHLQVEVLSDKPKLAAVESMIDENAVISNADVVTRLDRHLDKFLTF